MGRVGSVGLVGSLGWNAFLLRVLTALKTLKPLLLPLHHHDRNIILLRIIIPERIHFLQN